MCVKSCSVLESNTKRIVPRLLDFKRNISPPNWDTVIELTVFCPARYSQ